MCNTSRLLRAGLCLAAALMGLLAGGCAAPRAASLPPAAPVEQPAPEFSTTDVWLFTDPEARHLFPTTVLEPDIRREVMQNGPWIDEELEFLQEIRRLQREGAVVSVGFWWISPFPTVYQALRDGSLRVAGRRHEFRKGQSIVFQCRMLRAMQPELVGPLRIFESIDTREYLLCAEMKMPRRMQGEKMQPQR